MLCVQAFHCLVPAFFLTGMLNISSATSIIVSSASARIVCSLSSLRSRVTSARSLS
nr:MAG TPA: Tumor necrosis factor receptor superfamily member 19 [Caudoviricetes sp.]